MFLPAYSPDLNPIEMIFAEIKQMLRSLGHRTRESLWAAMQSVCLRHVAVPDCVPRCSKAYGFSGTLRDGSGPVRPADPAGRWLSPP
jgi:hypothetical protein